MSATLTPTSARSCTTTRATISYRAFIKSGNILIDTPQVAADTIDYVATDTRENSATSTRTVIIEADRSFNSSGTTSAQ
jgi:hypothetical protein